MLDDPEGRQHNAWETDIDTNKQRQGKYVCTYIYFELSYVMNIALCSMQ